MSEMGPKPVLLLVDDDATFCEVLARALSRRGFEVATATTLEQARELAMGVRPEYAVVDLCIGEQSGLPFVAELKRLRPAARTIVLTGFASIATAVEAVKLGAVHYLTKPAEPDDIVAAFERQYGDASIAPPARPMSPRRLEWEHIQRVLADHDGNISAAARAMGMHRRTLQRKLQKRPASA
jgi:two-component system response regulator RegA